MKKPQALPIILALLLTTLGTFACAAQEPPTPIQIPPNGGWVYGELESNQLNFSFEILKPSCVDVAVCAYTRCSADVKTEAGAYIDHFSRIFSGSAEQPFTQSMTLYLSPGKYVVSINDSSWQGRIGVKIDATAPDTTEQEPNQTFGQANPIASGECVRAIFAQPNEYDFFKITLQKQRKFLLRVEGAAANLTVYDREIDTLFSDSLTQRQEVVLTLSQGVNYLRFTPNTYGPYSFELVEAPAATSIFIPASMILPIGMSEAMDIKIQPESADLPDLVWQSSDPSIVSVEQSGRVTGNNPGKATVSAQSADDSCRASCDITVTENEFLRQAPLISPQKALYASAKRLHYEGGYLYADIFLYNNGEKSVQRMSDLIFYIADTRKATENNPAYGAVYQRKIGNWNLRPALKSGDYTIIKVRLPRGAMPMYNLASGRYEAFISAKYTEKGARRVRKIVPKIGKNTKS